MSFNTDPMTADEFEANKFSILDRVNRSKRGYSAKILYKDQVPLIETPLMRVTFPLRCYDYNNGPKKYALCVTLDPTTNGMDDLVEMVEGLDHMVDRQMKEEYKEDLNKLTQYSSLRRSKNDRYYDYLRCKLVNNTKRFKCDVFVDNSLVSQDIDKVAELLVKGTKVRLLVQVNPLWKMDQKYGITYQIKAIKIVTEKVQFKDEIAPKQTLPKDCAE